MPIRPENKSRYPKDWKLRRKFILRRADYCCEWCGVEQYAVGYRHDSGNFSGIRGTWFLYWAGHGMNLEEGRPLRYSEAKKIAAHDNECGAGEKCIVIVLTIAHVYDHRPEAASLLNLAALCQRCHLRHDIKHHQQSRQARTKNETKQIEMTL